MDVASSPSSSQAEALLTDSPAPKETPLPPTPVGFSPAASSPGRAPGEAAPKKGGEEGRKRKNKRKNKRSRKAAARAGASCSPKRPQTSSVEHKSASKAGASSSPKSPQLSANEHKSASKAGASSSRKSPQRSAKARKTVSNAGASSSPKSPQSSGVTVKRKVTAVGSDLQVKVACSGPQNHGLDNSEVALPAKRARVSTAIQRVKSARINRDARQRFCPVPGCDSSEKKFLKVHAFKEHIPDILV